MRSSFLRKVIFLAVSISGMGLSGFGQQPEPTTVAGRPVGSPFSDLNVPFRGRVSEVYIFAGDTVYAVQMRFALPDGRVLTRSRHGGQGGQQNIFRLDQDECIVGISGRYDVHIDSLRIHTNKRTSPLFGGKGGSQDYRIDVPDGNQAVGIVGRSGRYLNAIGLTFVPLTIPQAGQTTIVGGTGGAAFSDSGVPLGTRISEVRVRSGKTVHAIQAVYTLKDGRLLEGAVHGGEGGSLSVFRLDPNEYIIGLSGRSGAYIDSLSIETNKRTSQVFGSPAGSGFFGIKVPKGNQAIGFAGRSGSHLDAIGIIYATVETRPRPGDRIAPQR